jgi:hypothetical protein
MIAELIVNDKLEGMYKEAVMYDLGGTKRGRTHKGLSASGSIFQTEIYERRSVTT